MEASTKFCPQCGKQLPANAVFCSQCGTKMKIGGVSSVSPSPTEKVQNDGLKMMPTYGTGVSSNPRTSGKKKIRIWVSCAVMVVVIALAAIFFLRDEWYIGTFEARVSGPNNQTATFSFVISKADDGLEARITASAPGKKNWDGMELANGVADKRKIVFYEKFGSETINVYLDKEKKRIKIGEHEMQLEGEDVWFYKVE